MFSEGHVTISVTTRRSDTALPLQSLTSVYPPSSGSCHLPRLPSETFLWLRLGWLHGHEGGALPAKGAAHRGGHDHQTVICQFDKEMCRFCGNPGKGFIRFWAGMSQFLP